MAANTDYAAAKFARNLAVSNGDLGAYVIAKSGLLDDSQRGQLVAQLREKRRLHQVGTFVPTFLTGDIAVEASKVRGIDSASRRL